MTITGVKASASSDDQCSRHAKLSRLRTFCGTAGGDSGGGYFIEVFPKYYNLAGVESSSCQECDVAESVIYTNVNAYKDWIEMNAGTPTFQPKTLNEVSCEIEMCKPEICVFNGTIDSENYVLGSEVDTYVEEFKIEGNTNVEYLPRHIGKKFSKLKHFSASSCGLTIIRDFYFKNMLNLEGLFLDENKIAFVEPRAFVPLVKVILLSLQGNLIETFNENLFKTMMGLESIYLSNNRIKFLSPSTLEIPAARLAYIDLSGNVCIDTFYSARSTGWEQFEPDLIANCTQGLESHFIEK